MTAMYEVDVALIVNTTLIVEATSPEAARALVELPAVNGPKAIHTFLREHMDVISIDHVDVMQSADVAPYTDTI